MASSSLGDRKEEIEELVLMAQKGDHDAFSKLYDIFVDPIYRYIYFRVKAKDAEDLLETLFMKVWENLKQYKFKKNKSFSAWIFRIAHNLVVDYYRSSKKHETSELLDYIADKNTDNDPVKTTQSNLDKDYLKLAMSKLKKKHQEIIIYKFVNELSNKEIAQILSKTEGNLRILQFRALKALKKELEKMGMDY
jgi:RNA polymerase sigma factor (sigma-70 family)